jgi:hypothetical protein
MLECCEYGQPVIPIQVSNTEFCSSGIYNLTHDLIRKSSTILNNSWLSELVNIAGDRLSDIELVRIWFRIVCLAELQYLARTQLKVLL